eukprot:COSAG02_NODE_4469_length_5331_cov_1.979931_6_plen_124_part_00
MSNESLRNHETSPVASAIAAKPTSKPAATSGNGQSALLRGASLPPLEPGRCPGSAKGGTKVGAPGVGSSPKASLVGAPKPPASSASFSASFVFKSEISRANFFAFANSCRNGRQKQGHQPMTN